MNLFKALWYRLLHDPEPYAPEFASVVLDCGCADGPVVIGCMACGRTSCGEHRVHDHADKDKGGIDEEVRTPAACAAHLRVQSMNGTQVDTELAAMVRGHLADLWAAPARLEGLYLVPEEQR